MRSAASQPRALSPAPHPIPIGEDTWRIFTLLKKSKKLTRSLEKDGFPAKKILNSYLDAAEKQGYKWPVRYVVK